MKSDDIMIKDVVDLVGQLRVLTLKMEHVNDYNKNLDKALEELEKFHKAHNAEEIKQEIWSNINFAIDSMQIKFTTEKLESKIEELILNKFTTLIEEIKLHELVNLPVRLDEFERNMRQSMVNTDTMIKDTSNTISKHNEDLSNLLQKSEKNSSRLMAANKTIKSYKIWHLFSISMSFLLLGFLSSLYFQNNPITLTVEKEVEVPTRVNEFVDLHESEDGLYIISKKKLKRKNVYLSDTKNAVIKVK